MMLSTMRSSCIVPSVSTRAQRSFPSWPNSADARKQAFILKLYKREDRRAIMSQRHDAPDQRGGVLPGDTPKMRDMRRKLLRFIKENVTPATVEYENHVANPPPGKTRWSTPPQIEDLKKKARSEGLWNLFMPPPHTEGAGLTNAEYAHLAEEMGHHRLVAEACNCSAPDTGNMEVLMMFGTDEQKRKWLQPLLAGDIRSCFLMTEPDVASSDATNIETDIRREGNWYVINGRKWWSTGALDERCKIGILMGKTDRSKPAHLQQSMVLVPMDTPGITIVRPLTIMGYDDAPTGHPEIRLENVRVPVNNLLLGEGRGFEIAQARLGPGRVHHCMRAIGLAEEALSLLIHRALGRVVFGKTLAQQDSLAQQIASLRIQIDQARLLVLHCAAVLDRFGAGSRESRKLIAMIKVAVPSAVAAAVDRAIQVHGAAGLSGDFPLAYAMAMSRALRIADGPDEVHLRTISRDELRPYVIRKKRMQSQPRGSGVSQSRL